MLTVSERQRLRRLGQLDLADWIEIATGEELWSVQRQIAAAISKPRSRVAVPSCNASGKTWLAARIVLAFFDSYIPGTPCEICRGPCGGAKIITTSSKWEHLKDNLWGEIRMAYPKVVERVGFAGRMPPADLRIEYSPSHFAMGQSADKAEGFQGYHAAHKLILGDEATALQEQTAQGITSLLASGDSRLLLIFNPTTPDTYAALQCQAPDTEVVRITAWDTPHFSGEVIPQGSNLITPRFLNELQNQGLGPGTYEWTTRVEAKFWDMADDLLIPMPWVSAARVRQPVYGGVRALGIDLASYGSNENVLAVRDGLTSIAIRPYPSMRIDNFFEGPVLQAVREFQPHYVIYDADGVGAGAVQLADRLERHRDMTPGGRVLGFRGGMNVEGRTQNARSAWYWNLRNLFENGRIAIEYRDDELSKQLSSIHYSITSTGKIKVERKEDMHKRGMGSPDRADALMYSFALADDLQLSEVQPVSQAEEAFGVKDRSDAAMWARDLEIFPKERKYEVNVVLDCPDDW